MIEIKGLTKKYGALTALDNLSLNLRRGEIYGFIGPNGAGKTTTMKILAGLLNPDSGEAYIDGMDVRKHSEQIRRAIGYMPDFIGVYDDLTVDEYLQFFAAAFDIPRSRRRAVVDSVLELTDLGGKRHAMVESLSRGMTQRLGVARVLIHDPKVLLLDEPASGLDPRARIEMRSLLTELGRMGKTLIVSSHILSELGEMSTSIGIIERGKLLYTGTMADALSKVRGGERIQVTLADGSPATELVKSHIEQDHRVAKVAMSSDLPQQLMIDLTAGQHGHHFLLERLIAGGAKIEAFSPVEVRLEDAFLKLTTGALQ